MPEREPAIPAGLSLAGGAEAVHRTGCSHVREHEKEYPRRRTDAALQRRDGHRHGNRAVTVHVPLTICRRGEPDAPHRAGSGSTAIVAAGLYWGIPATGDWRMELLKNRAVVRGGAA